MSIRENRRRRGLSMVELLCVLAMIAVLAALVMGPAHKAYAKAKGLEWDMKAGDLTGEVARQLRRFYAGKSDYPAASLDDLHRLGVLDSQTVSILRWSYGKAQYQPFSSATPEDAVVLRVVHFGGDVDVLRKKEATEEPK